MPMAPPEVVTWGALLGACEKHHNKKKVRSKETLPTSA